MATVSDPPDTSKKGKTENPTWCYQCGATGDLDKCNFRRMIESKPGEVSLGKNESRDC